MTIPGIGELLGLTIASEIGDIARFPSAAQARRLLRPDPDDQAVRAELAHRPALQGRPRHAALGRRRGRPAGLAADQPLAPALHRHQAPPRQANPAKAAVARKVLIAAWHVLARQQPFKPSAARRAAAHRSCPGKLLHSSGRLTAHKRSEKPGQLQPTTCADPSAERDLSTHCRTARARGRTAAPALTSPTPSKRRVARRAQLHQPEESMATSDSPLGGVREGYLISINEEVELIAA